MLIYCYLIISTITAFTKLKFSHVHSLSNVLRWQINSEDGVKTTSPSLQPSISLVDRWFFTVWLFSPFLSHFLLILHNSIFHSDTPSNFHFSVAWVPRLPVGLCNAFPITYPSSLNIIPTVKLSLTPAVSCFFCNPIGFIHMPPPKCHLHCFEILFIFLSWYGVRSMRIGTLLFHPWNLTCSGFKIQCLMNYKMGIIVKGTR